MASFQQEFREKCREAWKPPPNLKVSEWADQRRKLSSEASAEPGQWYTDRAPYLRFPMDAYNNPQWKEIVMMFSSQTGKTEVLNNICGFNIDLNPGPMLVIQPTLDMGEAWSKDRLAPMLRDSPTLKLKVDTRARNGSNTLLQKQFPGGHLTIAGANSPASLASRPIRDVLADEIDRFPASAGNEGDPLNLAIQRTANFWNSTVIMSSTPTIKGASRIEMAYEKSQQYMFQVPCPTCDHKQFLTWKNLKIPQNSAGEYDTSGTYYVCEGNGCYLTERAKGYMLANGEWVLVGQGELKRRVGVKINTLYSPWMTWQEMADSWLESKDENELLQTFVNTKLGESWEIKHSGGMMLEAGSQCEDYDAESVPDSVLLITGAVDTQDDRLEFLSQGWGVKRERWNLEHKIFWGDTSKPEVWFELDKHLKRSYTVRGKQMRIAITLIDSGGHRTQEVYNFVKPRQDRRVFASKGSSSYYAPIANKGRQVGNQRVMLFEIGSDTAKDSILYSSLKLEKPGPGFIHHPKDCDQEYFDQLSMSEVRYKNKPTDRLGRKKKVVRLFEYQKLRERNEILDLHVLNMAAYYILNPDIDILAKRATSDVTEIVTPEPINPFKPLQPSRLKRPAKKRNWATNI